MWQMCLSLQVLSGARKSPEVAGGTRRWPVEPGSAQRYPDKPGGGWGKPEIFRCIGTHWNYAKAEVRVRSSKGIGKWKLFRQSLGKKNAKKILKSAKTQKKNDKTPSKSNLRCLPCLHPAQV